MEDVLYSVTDPYSVGNEIMVSLAEDDPNGHHHRTEGFVAEVLENSLGTDAGHGRGSLSYQIKIPDGIISIWLRHSDLVPHEDRSTN